MWEPLSLFVWASIAVSQLRKRKGKEYFVRLARRGPVRAAAQHDHGLPQEVAEKRAADVWAAYHPCPHCWRRNRGVKKSSGYEYYRRCRSYKHWNDVDFLAEELATDGRLECLKWLLRFRVTAWPAKCINRAAQKGHLDVFECSLDHGAPYDPECSSWAAERGHFPILNCILARELPWHERTTINVVWAARPDVLKCIQQTDRTELWHPNTRLEAEEAIEYMSREIADSIEVYEATYGEDPIRGRPMREEERTQHREQHEKALAIIRAERERMEECLRIAIEHDLDAEACGLPVVKRARVQ